MNKIPLWPIVKIPCLGKASYAYLKASSVEWRALIWDVGSQINSVFTLDYVAGEEYFAMYCAANESDEIECLGEAEFQTGKLHILQMMPFGILQIIPPGVLPNPAVIEPCSQNWWWKHCFNLWWTSVTAMEDGIGLGKSLFYTLAMLLLSHDGKLKAGFLFSYKWSEFGWKPTKELKISVSYRRITFLLCTHTSDQAHVHPRSLMFIRFLLLFFSFQKEEFHFGKLLYPEIYVVAFSTESL